MRLPFISPFQLITKSWKNFTAFFFLQITPLNFPKLYLLQFLISSYQTLQDERTGVFFPDHLIYFGWFPDVTKIYIHICSFFIC